MTVPLLQIDAFTDRPFAGNPAAVALLERPADEAWMQAVAAEMNLSETAFVAPEGDIFGLRWFTPTVEVPLCGHATLASAHALWSEGRVPPGQVIRFGTASGELRAAADGDRIALDLPSEPAVEVDPEPGLIEALGVTPIRVARSSSKWLIELASEGDVRAAAPDMRALAPFDPCVITALGEDVAVVSRCFAPGSGIDEDPVTGSAHCLLAPWWAPRLGRDEFDAAQLSARGGELHVRLAGDRVAVAGRAVTVLRGELL